MEHASKIASAIVDRLPKNTCSPETTEGKEAFFIRVSISGTLEKATIGFIVRDFTDEGLRRRKALLERHRQSDEEDFPRSTYRMKVKPQYRNMKQVIDQTRDRRLRDGSDPPHRIETAEGTRSAAALTLALVVHGPALPQHFRGEHAFHSRLEWVSRQDMEKADANHRAFGDDLEEEPNRSSRLRPHEGRAVTSRSDAGSGTVSLDESRKRLTRLNWLRPPGSPADGLQGRGLPLLSEYALNRCLKTHAADRDIESEIVRLHFDRK